MRAERPISRSERRQRDSVRFADMFFALAGSRPVSACREALPRDFLTCSIPSPAALVARFGDRLQPRTRNALERHMPNPKDSEGWTYDRLLALRGFGMFCLIDVMQALREPASARGQ
jgi:hypothetical protein